VQYCTVAANDPLIVLVSLNDPVPYYRDVIEMEGVAELMYDVALKIQKHYSKQDGIFSYI
jgi:hypothetical protein